MHCPCFGVFCQLFFKVLVIHVSVYNLFFLHYFIFPFEFYFTFICATFLIFFFAVHFFFFSAQNTGDLYRMYDSDNQLYPQVS